MVFGQEDEADLPFEGKSKDRDVRVKTDQVFRGK